MLLSRVRSWSYALPSGVNGFEPLKALPVDMIITGGFVPTEVIAELKAGGPQGSRLVIGYVDVAEFGTYLPEWNAAYDADRNGRPDAGAPDWLANANPAYGTSLYTVNFWTASWKQIVFRIIDDQIAKGFDGIFLDAILQYQAHSAGNDYGNAIRPTAAAEMAQLLRDIQEYVKVTRGLSNFQIIANSPHEMYASQPNVVNYYDGVVIESSYWGASPSDGLALGPGPTSYFDAVQATARPFTATGKPVFAVDYVPQPVHGTAYLASGADYNFDYFQKMIAYGYVGTLTHPYQRPAEEPNFPHYVFGGSGAESIAGLSVVGQTDYIYGDAGNDTLTGESGPNHLWGGEGDDVITGGSGFDYGHGNQGNDTLRGGDGDDWVVGGKDQDFLYGDAGADMILGNLGADTCYGGDGRDVVRGGQGDDVIIGEGGSDYMSGDRGADAVYGGAGADFFHTFADAGIDRVYDFSLAEGDRVLIDPGTPYTVSQVGGDVVIEMGGGNQMILVGVQLTTLGATSSWIIESYVWG